MNAETRARARPIDPHSVAVIVAAHDAAETIAGAVRSALCQPGVAEVCVVDDASSDRTAEIARGADDGTGRLMVERVDRNVGPAGARNRALALTSAPLVAILDADDRFAPDRFAVLPPAADWDLFADNVAFCRSAAELEAMDAPRPLASTPLDLAAFVRGNISRPGRPRGELGFLKPVLSRSFLDRYALRYDRRLRLGEDYDLYARALACGARMLVSPQIGYGALLRPGSLSARHGTADLAALLSVDVRLLASAASPSERRALHRHRRQIGARHALRRFLDRRATIGRRAALLELLDHPRDWTAVASGIARDKALPLFGSPAPARTLLPVPRMPVPRMPIPRMPLARTANGDAP